MIEFKPMGSQDKVICHVFFNIFEDGKEIGRVIFDLRTTEHSFCFPTTLKENEEVNAAAKEFRKTLNYEYRPEVFKYYTGTGTIVGYKDLLMCGRIFKLACIKIGEETLESCLFDEGERNQRIEKPVGSKIGVHYDMEGYYFNDDMRPFREYEETIHYWVKNDTINN